MLKDSWVFIRAIDQLLRSRDRVSLTRTHPDRMVALPRDVVPGTGGVLVG